MPRDGLAQCHIGLCTGSPAAGAGSDVLKAGLLNGVGGALAPALFFPLAGWLRGLRS